MTDVTNSPNHRGGNTLHHVCAGSLAPQDSEEAGDVVFRTGQAALACRLFGWYNTTYGYS